MTAEVKYVDSDTRRRLEDSVDRLPEDWNDVNFKTGRDQDSRTLKSDQKTAPAVYRENRLHKSTRAQHNKRLPTFRLPAHSRMLDDIKKHPARFGKDERGRSYMFAAKVFPDTQTVDEAWAFYETVGYANGQKILYVVLPRASSEEFPMNETLVISWPGEVSARRYRVHTAEYPAKRCVGVAVVTSF